jgi:osmotically inducible lipoprotein OsmB
MNNIQRISIAAVVTTMLLGLGACAGMSRQDNNTAIGAGVGAVGGAALTGGSAVGTAAGAVGGGVIGHEVKKD